MKIKWTSVLVDDQKKALKFYTEILGFIKKTDVPMGEHSWLTVVSKEEPDGAEIVLEPMGFAPAKVYQKGVKGCRYTINYVSCRECSKRI